MNGEENKIETKGETEFVFMKRDTASEYQMVIPQDIVKRVKDLMKDNIDNIQTSGNGIYVDFISMEQKTKQNKE